MCPRADLQAAPGCVLSQAERTVETPSHFHAALILLTAWEFASSASPVSEVERLRLREVEICQDLTAGGTEWPGNGPSLLCPWTPPFPRTPARCGGSHLGSGGAEPAGRKLGMHEGHLRDSWHLPTDKNHCGVMSHIGYPLIGVCFCLFSSVGIG